MKSLDEGKLNRLVNKLSLEFFEKPFHHHVTYNHRLRTTGGRYIPGKKRIEVNPKYVMEMGEEDYIGIIKHELCHYHLHIKGKGYQHGNLEFKELLKATGSPRHCKPLPSSEKRLKHTYTCTVCNTTYERIRTVNIKKYRCGKCRGKIKKVTVHN